MSKGENSVGVILVALGYLLLVGAAISVLIFVFCLGGAYGGMISISNYIKSLKESTSFEKPTPEISVNESTI